MPKQPSKPSSLQQRPPVKRGNPYLHKATKVAKTAQKNNKLSNKQDSK